MRALKARKKYLQDFILLTGVHAKEDISEIMRKEALACNMKNWGNLTVYIGKIKREVQEQNIEGCETDLLQVKDNLRKREEELNVAKEKTKNFLENELAARNSAGLLVKIFNKAKYQAAMNLAEEHKKDAEEQKNSVSLLAAETKK